jgi:hypothetical protein
MRSISSTLETAEKAVSSTPYVRVRIDGTNYSSNTGKLLGVQHREEPYHAEADIILKNNDRALDDVDLRGEFLEIAYGRVTSTGNEYPSGGNDATSGLYVKSQFIYSQEGKSICVLHCEGLWDVLREKRPIILADPPSYDVTYNRDKTVYQIISLLVSSCDYDLEALGDQDDGIINDFKPYFQINYFPYEDVASLVYPLISMTKCFLRAVESKKFKVVYPQESDDVDETYYSNQARFFYNYVESVNELVPNGVVVYGNQSLEENGLPDTGSWKTEVHGEAKDQVAIDRYDAGEILWDYAEPYVLTETDCTNRAEAILSKFKAEMLSGRLVIPHDCRVELYDRVAIYDGRGL